MSDRIKNSLLLIGDKHSDRADLRVLFEDKYHIVEAENLKQGTLLLEQNAERTIAVIIDVKPGGDKLRGFTAKVRSYERKIPAICLVDNVSAEEVAFLQGADDVVVKPYAENAILRRVETLVDLYMHHNELETLVAEQSESIRRNNQIMIDTLSSIIEYRSDESGKHVLRVRHFTKLLLEEVAQNHPEYMLTPTTIDIITAASALHDIGKVSIPDTILNKPSRLTKDECAIMKTHTTVGSRLIDGLKALGDTEYLRYIYNIILYHHERYDGKGYPEGLVGEQIPICAQVVGLVDAYDAVTTKRVYKDAYPHEVAVNMILNGECGAFSPQLLECFKRVQGRFGELAKLYADGQDPSDEEYLIPLVNPAAHARASTPLQLALSKNNALLQLIDSTVIEMDMDAHTYHIIYSPDADFRTIFNDTPFDKLPYRLLRESVHPDDAPHVAEQYGVGMQRLFRQGVYRHVIHARLYSSLEGGYVPNTIVMQRVVTSNPAQQLMLVVFRKERDARPHALEERRELLEETAVHDLVGATLCCKADEAFTIIRGGISIEPILGCRFEDFSLQYHNSLLQVVVPEDREPFRRSMQRALLGGDREEVVIRVRYCDGPESNVLCKIRAIGDTSGEMHFYVAMWSIDSVSNRYSELERMVKNIDAIYMRSGTIAYEWNAAADTFRSNPTVWKERFGYEVSAIADFSKHIGEGGHFHPDDMDALRNAFENLCAGSATEVFDLRIITNEGEYLWNRVRAVSIMDEDDTIIKITGVIYDIHGMKKEALSAFHQARRDELTKLYNRASTQQNIREYLDRRENDAYAALLMLDIDNFKLLNDRMGHMYGDAVLRQMGKQLKGFFRSRDVVGRVGGDEFMVLLKDVPGAELVEEKCRSLVERLGELLSAMSSGLPVSVSVGCAIAPEHGTTFGDLYRHADEALYNAKNAGKNCYHIYSRYDKTESFLDSGDHSTRIDSDTRGTSLDDDVTRFVFRTLYDSRDIEKTLQEMLAFVGVYFNVSRVYIFENSDDNLYCSNTFEWCNAGILPEIDNLQNICYATDLPDWEHVYDEHGILYCTDVSQLEHPTARAILEPQGIKSLLHSTIRDQGVFRGYIGFDECKENVLWSREQVEQLKLLASVLALFVQKLRTMEKEKK